MKPYLAALLITLISTPALAADPPKNDDQKTFYAIGANVARSLAVFNLTAEEFELVKQGLLDTQTGRKTDFEVGAYNSKIQELARARRKALGDKQAVAGKEFIEKAAQEKGAVKTSSGMVYIPVTEGKGDSPKASDMVKVNYRGTLPDGREFDSSYKRGKALEFKLDGVIKCWTEGVQMIKPGGKAKLVCPPHLAYGDTGAGEQILPGATLNFEVELLDVKKSARTPKTPIPATPSTMGTGAGK